MEYSEDNSFTYIGVVMQERLENVKPFPPLNSIDPNPFYLNTYGPLGAHYLVGDAITTPFLYTTGITECVGIGFYYWLNGKVQKLGIFHSYSEHGNCNEELIAKALVTAFENNPKPYQNNLIRAIHHFLYDIVNLDNVIIVIHANNADKAIVQPEDSLTYNAVVGFVNKVCRVIGKGDIKKNNFLYSQNSTNFCLMNNGVYLVASADGRQDETIAKNVVNYIFEDILASHRKLGLFHGKKVHVDGHQKRVSTLEYRLLKCFKAANSGKMSWVEACFHINEELVILENKDNKTQKSFDKIKFMLQYVRDAHILERYELQQSPIRPSSLDFAL